MKRAYVAALAALLLPCAALAQDAPPPTQTADVAPASAAPPAQSTLPPWTPLQIEITQTLNSSTAQRGDMFTLRLVEPVIINGVEVAPAGTPGAGEVVDASPAGPYGLPGKLVIATRYIEIGGQRVNVRGLAIAGSGENRSSSAMGLARFGGALGGLAGAATRGSDTEIYQGTRAQTYVADPTPAPALTPVIVTDAQGIVPLPPPGYALIVFFRESSSAGSPGWAAYILRENGVEIGRLPAWRYILYAVPPGLHEFEAQHAQIANRPTEQSDRLRLEVEAGHIYYVAAVRTRRVGLLPSDHPHFAEIRPRRIEPAE